MFYNTVLNDFNSVRKFVFLELIVAAALAGCAGSGEFLNSDRISRTFGNYGVDVVESEGRRRVSSLYSADKSGRTTRTYALVELTAAARPAYAREHALIETGQSIGATFRAGGWAIDKQHLFIGELEIPETYGEIGELMHISLPAMLATHQYILNVSKDERSYSYATITEIHHPDYLKAMDLKAIYGEIIFDDSNRDAIHDFIGPPKHRK